MIPENKKPEPRKYTQGKERNHFKYFSKYGEMLEPTEVEIKRTKEPSKWDMLYEGMTPIEKGSWNAQQRKKGMDGKTAEPINQPKLEKPKKKKPTTEPVKINFDPLPMRTASLMSNVRDSSIYKLLENPKVMGVELGHDGIMEAINLLQSSGMFKKGGKIK